MSISAAYRWCQRGLRGVKLETIRVGGALITSREAVQRFANQLTQLDRVANQADAVPPLDLDANLEEALDEIGI